MRRALCLAAVIPTGPRGGGGGYAPMTPQASSALVPYQARVVLTWDSPSTGSGTQLFVLVAACVAMALAVVGAAKSTKPEAARPAPPLTTPAAKLGRAAAASPCSVDLLDSILRDVDAELRAVRGA